MAYVTEINRCLPLSVPSPVNISPKFMPDSVWKILAAIHCTPVTLPNRDLQGRTLQLWKYKDVLKGTVTDAEGNVRFFSGRKICNPCNPHEEDHILLQRLESADLKQWHLGYSSRTGEIHVFPYLRAAGRNDPHYVAKQIKQIQEKIPGIKEEHFKPSDLDAAKRELAGEVVAWKKITHYSLFGGTYRRPFLHYKEVQETQDNCTRLLNQLEKLLRRSDITQEERQQIKSLTKEIFVLRRQSYAFVPKDAQPPKGFAFREPLQINHLTEGYNGSHPKNPISPKGGSDGSIGGVGNDVGIIEGLFETTKDLEENLHYFYIPSADGKVPFSQKELQQILRELALGIYVHETIPFFSLHFNSDTNMYPVIHPVYEHTLVGRVISLLDYYMKGFLNGGFFDELFLKDWQKFKSQDLKMKCIDIHNYCKKNLGNDVEYLSVREMIDNCKKNISSLEKAASKGRETLEAFAKSKGFGEAGKLLFDEFLGKPDPPIFSDYSGFRSSFRIIAKQNSIKKSGNIFELDGDFDVFYTIEPDPSYEEALQKYRYEYGCDPPGYLRLVHAYELMVYQIRTVMPKLPLFSELFEQLKVINFLCYYLKTLKKAQKIPVFSRKELDTTLGCIPLFPHLPIRKMRTEKVEINFGKIFEKMALPSRQKLEKYLFSTEGREEPSQEITDSLLHHFREYLQESLKTLSISQEKEFSEEHKTFIVQFLKGQRKSIQDLKSRQLSGKEQIRYNAPTSKLSTGAYNSSPFQEGDTELLLRFTLLREKGKLLELKQREKQALQSIAHAEQNEENCHKALRRIDRNWTYNTAETCKKLRHEIYENLEKTEAYLCTTKTALESIQAQIAGIESCSTMVSLFSSQTTPYRESKTVIEFYSEQPEEEREENKRIVGGCGLNLKNLPVTPVPIELSLVSQMVSGLVFVKLKI